MQVVWNVLRLIGTSVGEYARQPELMLVGALVLWLVYRQYVRLALLEMRLLGVVRTHPREHTLASLGAGAIGGVFATALFVFLGLPLNGVSMLYLWVLALLLMFIQPRFLCFSYAGGIISAAALLGLLPDVDVAAVIALVAAMHLIEAVLIVLTGAEGAVPAYVRAPSERVVGGFILQRYWPIPFLALVAATLAPDAIAATEYIPMPSWWPLFDAVQVPPAGEQLTYFVLPVLAALGYSDFTVTRSPRRKAYVTSGTLSIYSGVLLVLAYAAQFHRIWAWVAALGAPLGHELVLWIGRRMELRGQPLYVIDRGPMVLAVAPGSPADRMGLRTGDVIRRVNGAPVNTRAEFVAAVSPWVVNVEFEVENVETGRSRTVRFAGKIPPLGVQFVPEASDTFVVDPLTPQSGVLMRLWRKMTKPRRGAKHE